MSPKRYLANAFNPMKTGKYSSKVPHCHTCIFRERCSAYDPKEPKAACKVIDIPNYFHLMSALTFKNEEDFDDFISKQVQRMYLKNLTSDDWAKLRDFVLMLVKLRDTKYKTPKEQTVNIQINNFQSEFTIFKDVTIQILKYNDFAVRGRKCVRVSKGYETDVETPIWQYCRNDSWLTLSASVSVSTVYPCGS